MPKTVLITGASSGFGAMTARALADAGHTVYAGMRDMAGRNRRAAADAAAYAGDHDVALRGVELDVSDQDSVDRGVASILEETDGLDVVVHNAGHMVLGPTEAFTPEQLHAVYDTNGATEVNALGDRVRERFYHQIGLEDLLHPALTTSDRPATA